MSAIISVQSSEVGIHVPSLQTTKLNRWYRWLVVINNKLSAGSSSWYDALATRAGVLLLVPLLLSYFSGIWSAHLSIFKTKMVSSHETCSCFVFFVLERSRFQKIYTELELLFWVWTWPHSPSFSGFNSLSYWAKTNHHGRIKIGGAHKGNFPLTSLLLNITNSVPRSVKFDRVATDVSLKFGNIWKERRLRISTDWLSLKKISKANIN